MCVGLCFEEGKCLGVIFGECPRGGIRFLGHAKEFRQHHRYTCS